MILRFYLEPVAEFCGPRGHDQMKHCNRDSRIDQYGRDAWNVTPNKTIHGVPTYYLILTYLSVLKITTRRCYLRSASGPVYAWMGEGLRGRI